MPTITFTLSAAASTEVTDALCAEYGYKATLTDGSANPETRAQFARRMVLEWIKARVKTYRQDQARQAASAADPDIT